MPEIGRCFWECLWYALKGSVGIFFEIPWIYHYHPNPITITIRIITFLGSGIPNLNLHLWLASWVEFRCKVYGITIFLGAKRRSLAKRKVPWRKLTYPPPEGASEDDDFPFPMVGPMYPFPGGYSQWNPSYLDVPLEVRINGCKWLVILVITPTKIPFISR